MHLALKSAIVIFMVTIQLVFSQRPPYAGSGPIGRPGLASRFQVAGSVDIDDRLGEAEVSTKYPLPVDALGDADLVNRLNDWPREHRPFWLINSAIIEAAKNPQKQLQPTQAQTVPKLPAQIPQPQPAELQSLQLQSMQLQQEIMRQKQLLQILQQHKVQQQRPKEPTQELISKQQEEFQLLMQQYQEQQQQIIQYQQQQQEYMDQKQSYEYVPTGPSSEEY